MAVGSIKPFIEVFDSNGDPVSGAKLHVYEAGTTTNRAIYSDASLTTPLANPLTSDAAGRFAQFYHAAGTYKLRCTTSGGTLIWQHDNIDTGLAAGTGALPISGGGTGATTAAAARTNLDVPSNSELTDLADAISALTASLQALIAQPQGRLTMTSATPVLTTGVTAGSAVYYTPYTGAQISIYDGVIFNVKTFAELTLTLNASHTANSIYDVFVWEESGVVTVGTGVGWNTATAGAGARGTGAGTTELTRLSGILVNAVSMTMRNGATTYTVDANKATYVGSIYMDGTNGQLSCLTAYGQSRKWGVWNAYNRRPIILRAGDATATWSASGVRQLNGSANNFAAVFCGLAEEPAKAVFRQMASGTVGATGTMGVQVGIGVNSTTVFSGYAGRPSGGAASSNLDVTLEATGSHVLLPVLGLNNLNMLEDNVGSAITMHGGQEDCEMTVEWWG